MEVLLSIKSPQDAQKKESTRTNVTFSDPSRLTSTTVAEQVNLITLCALLPHGAFQPFNSQPEKRQTCSSLYTSDS